MTLCENLVSNRPSIVFPDFSGIRCLMLPYIQGEPDSVPYQHRNGYEEILGSIYIKLGTIGFLTIDESIVSKGKPHRGARAKFSRALHTEAGLLYGENVWGGQPTWGGKRNVILDRDVRVLLANNIDRSCAIWDTEHENTTEDGDIGHLSHLYPYDSAIMMKANDVHQIGIFTPHESLPMATDTKRQFLRIISSGVHGREPYFTENPLMVS